METGMFKILAEAADLWHLPNIISVLNYSPEIASA